MLYFIVHVLHYVTFGVVEHDGETGSQVMTFENTYVRITDGERMLGSHNELVGVAWVLIIMEKTSNEGTKDIVAFKTLANVSVQYEIVQTLHTVEDVSDAMVWVLLKIALIQLSGKVNNAL